MLRYSLLVLLGACSYGILAIFVKLAYAEGFSLGGNWRNICSVGLFCLLLHFYFLDIAFL